MNAQSPVPTPVLPAPDELAEAYSQLTDRCLALERELGALNQQITPLVQVREEKTVELSRAAVEKKRVRDAFRHATGLDVRKHLRPPSEVAVERAQGALIAAICAPGNLPLCDPVVQVRLATLRDAIAAHRAYKERERLERTED